MRVEEVLAGRRRPGRFPGLLQTFPYLDRRGRIPLFAGGGICYEEDMMIEAETSIPTLPFEHAAATARAWFAGAEIRDDTCVIRLDAASLEDLEVRDRVCSICGNTPGLADALIRSLDESRPGDHGSCGMQLVIRRDDTAEIPINHPGENADRVRHALS